MWKKGDFYFSAAIPANILTISDANTPFRNANKLFEGDLMYGSYLDIRLIGDPDLDDVYTELVGIITDLAADEKVLEARISKKDMPFQVVVVVHYFFPMK